MHSRVAIIRLIWLQTLMVLGASEGLRAAESAGHVEWNPTAKTIVMADASRALELRLRYDPGCILDRLRLHGMDMLSTNGVWTGVKFDGTWVTTADLSTPAPSVSNLTATLSGIRSTGDGAHFLETWQFTALVDRIVWRIEREYLAGGTVDDTALPAWNFADLSTWTGALLGHGGVAWGRLFDRPNATYGIHAGDALFWNRETRVCLRISPVASAGDHVAMRFTRQPDNGFSCVHTVTSERLTTRHDLNRFLRDRQDVWAPSMVQPRTVAVEFTLQALEYDQVMGRGNFRGLNAAAVREILNTIARIGAIDDGILGSNGYYSGYAVLHEPWIAQLGLAINDPAYLRAMSRTLDAQRDHAIGSDGRVKSRWSYNAGDAMPGTYDAHGFYECQWGWLMDSQPSHVINVAEQFDLTGDLGWVREHKASCERALDYLLRRDRDNDGLVEMMTDSHREARGSDWIDIIWAAHENAFVNAQLFHALQLWADVESILDDPDRAAGYRLQAARLKQRFNADTTDGGLWDPEERCYVHWRDRDDSIHGRNLVVPVNFMALAYGLCEPSERARALLDEIETRMQLEGLFFWPICFESYQAGEGAESQFPFPEYENGDLFLAWGELGMRAYAPYKPELAVKYLRNVLDQYERDGLICQRYLRSTQQGAGNDLLANNCSPVVGLYRNVYGIQPRWNRLLLDPHLVPELYGTTLRYDLRGQEFDLRLSVNDYHLGTGWFALRSRASLGLRVGTNQAAYYRGSSDTPTLTFTRAGTEHLDVDIQSWPSDPRATRSWAVASAGSEAPLRQRVSDLAPNARYQLVADDHLGATLTSDVRGELDLPLTSTTTRPTRFELRSATGSRIPLVDADGVAVRIGNERHAAHRRGERLHLELHASGP